MEMSEIIRNERKKAGLTQEELAKKLGVQKSAIAKYESGRVENVKRSSIQKMAEIFGCDPAYLMGFRDEPLDSSNSEHDRMTAYAEGLLHQLDDEDIHTISDQMEFMLSRDKY